MPNRKHLKLLIFFVSILEIVLPDQSTAASIYNLVQIIISFLVVPFITIYYFTLYRQLKEVRGEFVFAPARKSKGKYILIAVVGALIFIGVLVVPVFFLSSLVTALTLIIAVWFTRWLITAKELPVVGIAISIGLLFLYFNVLGFWARKIFGIRA